MDWLAQYHARLDCRAKVAEYCILRKATLKLDVKGTLVSAALISKIQVSKLLTNGAQAYLTFLINTPTDKVKLEDVQVINEHLDVFSKKLVSLLSETEIEFKIDLAPETAPISKLLIRWHLPNLRN